MKLKNFLDNNNLELKINFSLHSPKYTVIIKNTDYSLVEFSLENNILNILNDFKSLIESNNSLVFQSSHRFPEHREKIEIENIDSIEITKEFLLQKQIEFL